MQTDAKLCNLIDDLVEYAIQSELAEESDRIFLCNRICSEFGILHFVLDQNREKNTNLEIILASLCDISEDYLRKIFHNTYRTTPVKYINELKMQYAKELLATGEYSVGEAALLSGFEDAAYFSREFHRVFGVTPAKYKEIQ